MSGLTASSALPHVKKLDVSVPAATMSSLRETDSAAFENPMALDRLQQLLSVTPRAGAILSLQRARGNLLVQHLVQSIGRPDDPYEREANRAAQRAMQATPRPSGVSSAREADHVGLRAMQTRIHNDTNAAEYARALGAKAFTVGSDMFFASGQYAPDTAEGRSLLAHELTHTVQQASGGAPLLQMQHAGASRSPLSDQLRATRPPAKSRTARDARELITAQYPHLAKVLSPTQFAQVQRVLIAEAQIKKLREREAPFERSFLSEDVERREQIDAEIGQQGDLIFRNRTLVVPTERLLADDVRRRTGESQRERDFRDGFYAQLTAFPVLVTVAEEVEAETWGLLRFTWGPGGWVLTHDGGLIRFGDLMRIEKFNLAYQQVLLEQQVEVLGKMKGLTQQLLDPEGQLEVLIKDEVEFEFDPAVLHPAADELLDMAKLRDAYRRGCDAILDEAKLMLKNGKTLDEVADWAVQSRNALKRQIREEGPRIVKVLAEARNMRKYGNTVGPSAEELRASGRSSEEIIEGVARSNRQVTRWAGRLRIAGRILIAIDIGIAAYEVASAPEVDRPRVLLEEASAIGGAIAGAALFAKGGGALGAKIGALAGPEGLAAGAAVGAVVGGVVGAFIGAWTGRKAAHWVASELYPPEQTRFEGSFQ